MKSTFIEHYYTLGTILSISCILTHLILTTIYELLYEVETVIIHNLQMSKRCAEVKKFVQNHVSNKWFSRI